MIIIIIIITISIIIVIIIMIYIYITDMCCCQLASAVAHLPPVLASSCLCFVAPKQRPDSGPKNEATILKLIAQLPNLWPQFWARFAFCKECVGLRQVVSSIHVFLALGARMLVSHAGYAVKEGKKHAGPQPQKWVRVAAQAKKERFKRCRDARAVLQQAWLPQAMQRHAHRQRQCTEPCGATPGTPKHQSWLNYFRTLQKAATPRKAARLAFVSGNVDSWGTGPCLRAHIHIHHAELNIRIGLAAKLLKSY